MKALKWIKEHSILLLLLLTAAFLRFYKLDYQSLWIDEIFTVNIAAPENSFAQIFDFLKVNDPHPPFYYFLIHIFFCLFGYTAFVLKLFSAMVGVLGILSIYFLGKEILNKRVGLIAAYLTTFNYFHIFYSQEGRMYSLLFFTTCLAVLYLLRFIKTPNYKSILLFVMFSTLMAYSHFFGVFMLISFYGIILFYTMNSDDKKNRLKLAIASGLMTIVLYIPAIIVVFSNQQRDSFWIQAPNFKTFDLMLGEFFGYNSTLKALVMVIFGASIIYYFIQRKRQSKAHSEMGKINPILLLLVWIFGTILISLIYSFVALPIIVSRYFIGILPAIILLLAILIHNFKVKYLELAFVAIFAVFSLKALIDKSFYSGYYKTQFREGVQNMANKKPNDLIVFRHGGFYLTYYLNQFNSKQQTIDADINAYVTGLKQTQNLVDFWYFDAHNSDYSPTNATKEFLENKFIMDNTAEYFDAYCKHFTVKKGL
jgi:mannosyltransferase